MENKQRVIELLKGFASVSGRVFLLGMYLVASFFLGVLAVRIDEHFRQPTETNPFKNVKYPQTVSVAINESNDMLLMDKTTGEYQIYSDSVGLAIFKLYVNKMYVKANNETSK